MADAAVDLRWSGEGLRFEGGPRAGARLTLDGNGKAGISPVQALLLSLVGCTAADVIEILGKMRLAPRSLTVRAEADRAAEPPRRYTAVLLVYEVEGLAAEHEPKLRRAIDLSHEKYCSVLHTWRPDVQIRTEVVLRHD